AAVQGVADIPCAAGLDLFLRAALENVLCNGDTGREQGVHDLLNVVSGVGQIIELTFHTGKRDLLDFLLARIARSSRVDDILQLEQRRAKLFEVTIKPSCA